MNKRGNMVILVMFLAFIMIAMFYAFITVLGSSIITYSSDTLNDITSDLGMAGSSNLSEYSDMTVGTVNTALQMLKWGAGVIVAVLILAILIFAGAVRVAPSKFLIGGYVLIMMLIVFTSIILSNVYEDIYQSGDEIADELHEMGMANFLLTHMPLIICVVGFIGGVVIFTGLGEEEYV